MMDEELMLLLKPNIHANLETEDYFNLKPKAESIKGFLDSLSLPLTIKMIALYGEWGSGKTSLMKWLESEEKSSDNKVVFFEAWQHELYLF